MQDIQDVQFRRILDEILASAPKATEIMQGKSLRNACKPSIETREYNSDRKALEFHLTGYEGRGQVFYLKVPQEDADKARKALLSLNSKVKEYFSD